MSQSIGDVEMELQRDEQEFDREEELVCLGKLLAEELEGNKAKVAAVELELVG